MTIFLKLGRQSMNEPFLSGYIWTKIFIFNFKIHRVPIYYTFKLIAKVKAPLTRCIRLIEGVFWRYCEVWEYFVPTSEPSLSFHLGSTPKLLCKADPKAVKSKVEQFDDNSANNEPQTYRIGTRKIDGYPSKRYSAGRVGFKGSKRVAALASYVKLWSTCLNARVYARRVPF